MSQNSSLETLEVYHVEKMSKKDFHSGLYWMSSKCLLFFGQVYAQWKTHFILVVCYAVYSQNCLKLGEC